MTTGIRIGHGYDVHRLAEGRELILGGVEIPYHLGLLGHSDADVLTHAVMDSLLGAAALGDIGKLFPDTDEAFRGISSLKLLAVVAFLWLTSPVASHLIGRLEVTVNDQLPQEMQVEDSRFVAIEKEADQEVHR